MTEVAAVIVRECIRYVAETDIIGDAMHLSSDLGFDSLNRVEVRQAIEDSLGIEISETERRRRLMGDKIRIDIVDRPQLLRTLWTLGGAAKALEALPGPDTVSGKLPGIGMARAIVERVVAEERVFPSQETFKAVAKAGHDVTLCKAVTTAFDPGGKPYLEAEFYDLADMAEG